MSAKTLLPAIATAIALSTVASAAVPLKWTVETSRATPAEFTAYQGETLEFEAALTSRGKPLQAPLNYALYWQTNGMGGVYWSTNCAAGVGATNVMRATWRPEYDVGAKTYNCFIGAPGDIYRAAFLLRLRPSPGATPGALPLPTPTIDFSRVTVLNPPWPTNDLTSAVASNAAAIATNAAAIASHSSQLSQLSQAVDAEAERATTAEAEISQFIDEVADHCDTHLEMEERERMTEDGLLATRIDMTDAAVDLLDATVAALDAALREYPRTVRRGGTYYTEDIVDRGGDDITYTLTRFPVVSFSAAGAASSLTVTKTATAAVSLEVGDGRADFAPLEFGRAYPLPVGATLYVRAPADVTNATLYGCKVATDGKVAVGGNIMALVAQDEPKTIPAASCFKELFKDSLGIVDASGLALPATNLTNYCYQKMFAGCMDLVRGPTLLPAVTSVTGCYSGMFDDCREMVSGPTIMLEDVASTCCYVMFVDCWQLQSVSMPNQTGKTAAGAAMSNSLRGMIQNTGNVRHISVPSLQTFGSCDKWVFVGDDKPFVWPADGTFVCPAALGDNETIARGVSACPPGWTVINK